MVNRLGTIGRGSAGTNVPHPGPSFEPGAESLPCCQPEAAMPRRNRCGRGRVPEPPPAATARPGRGDSPRLPETPSEAPPETPPETAPEAPRGRTRDGESSRRGGGHRHRKPRTRSAAARRSAAGALLLLAGALGVLGSAEAQVGTLALNVDRIAGDDTVNIAEKRDGFTISGDTGAEAGAMVTVTVGGMMLSEATSSDANPATWSVTVPPAAAYLTGTSVSVSVSATKAGFTAAAP